MMSIEAHIDESFVTSHHRRIVPTTHRLMYPRAHPVPRTQVVFPSDAGRNADEPVESNNNI